MIPKSKSSFQIPHPASYLSLSLSRCRHTHLARNHRRPSAFTPSPIPCLNSHPAVVVRRLGFDMKIVSHTKHLLLRFHTGYSESKVCSSIFDFSASISLLASRISQLASHIFGIQHLRFLTGSRKYRDERDMGEGAEVKDEFPRIAYSGHLLICQIFETKIHTVLSSSSSSAGLSHKISGTSLWIPLDIVREEAMDSIQMKLMYL
ncbi:hypothetical protein LXL04_015523 [Taraxacum kok-saghyz]